MLRCYHYIALNPVRARLTYDPAAWRWSSCAANTGQRPRFGLAPHVSWLSLGGTDAARASAYRALLDEALDDHTLTEIRAYLLQQQRALGHDTFRAMVEAKTRRFAGTRPAHRPPRQPSPQK